MFLSAILEKRQESEDGHELTMATNHFGHFLLTNLLLGWLLFKSILKDSSVEFRRKTMTIPCAKVSASY